MANLTPKQTAFANSLRDGLSQTDAYRLHYSTDGMIPATIHNSAYELANHPEIQARLASFDKKKIESWAWDYERAMVEIEKNINLARLANQHGPARASTRDAIELSGLWKEKKSESDVPIIKQTIILQARPASPELPAVDAEYQVLEPSEPTDTVDSPDC